MAKVVTLGEVLDLADQLSALDKVRLIEHITPQIEQVVAAFQPVPRKSLLGAWAGVDISEEDIAEARREMWGNFPREDI
jgi:hypothetical protein